LSLFEKVSQSNSRFNTLNTLVVTVHSVKKPVGFAKRALSVLIHLKRNIVEMKAEENCPAHALIIAIAKLHNDANYILERKGSKIRSVVQMLLQEIGIDLTNGAGIPEINRFQKHFRDYKIVVYQGLGFDDVMFEFQTDSAKRLNLFYDDVERNYHVITELTGAMAKKYVYIACRKSCMRDITQVCDQKFNDGMASPPCAFCEVRFNCDECNTHFRSRSCFANHKQNSAKGKFLHERKRCCATCGILVTYENHECNKLFCAISKQNRDVVYLCYMRPINTRFPPPVIRYSTYF